jgi:hypothetical protein
MLILKDSYSRLAYLWINWKNTQLLFFHLIYGLISVADVTAL